MVENVGKDELDKGGPRNAARGRRHRGWGEADLLEVWCRRALGQTQDEIGDAMGRTGEAVRARLKTLKDAPFTRQSRLYLLRRMVALRAMAHLLDAVPGSAAEGRLLARLEALNETEEEQDVAQTRDIGDMDEDELRAFVADLVPRLETKSAGQADSGAGRVAGAVSVPADGAGRAEAANRGDARGAGGQGDGLA